jgi:asparagine synthase (glutamine-hydrolysing)
MCGINGAVGPGKVPLQEMNALIAHRGPDFAGIYEDGNVHLGHLLLAIREMSELSKQPVMRNGSPWVMVFNGQVYNTRELSKKFSIPYHDLDTTVIYNLIEKVGWDFVRHIQGMFALALYNKDEGITRLYRDQSGQKQIYYTSINGTFVFSSEIKSLIKAGAKAETSREGLMVATALGYIPGHLTLFKDIYKLDAGEVVTVKADGSCTRAYFESDTNRFEGEPAEVMHELVAEHLASKQKVALNLSGGLDSSVLLHEMKEAGHTLATYTTSFESAGENFNDDAQIAKRLAKEYGTTHTEIVITRDIYLKNFIDAYALIEEPNYNISLPTYLEVAKREGVNGDGNRVILSGDGGDEIFGGYTYYGRSIRYQRLMSVLGPLFSVGKWARTGRYWNHADPCEDWLSFKYFDFEEMTGEQAFVTDYVKDIAKRRKLPLDNPLRALMILDRTLWMPGENFIRSDKLYMSESLELRSPLSYEPLRAYFDARLTEEDYFQDTDNKVFLRNLYRGKLPDYVIDRKDKTGWRSPVRPWYDARFKELFLGILADAPRGGAVRWDYLMDEVKKSDAWPGKYFFLYLSLAILSKKHGIIL